MVFGKSIFGHIEDYILADDVNGLQKLLTPLPKHERQYIVNSPGKFHNLPLEAACVKGHVNIVRYLLDCCGADVEPKPVYNEDVAVIYSNSPLLSAVKQKRLNIIKLLLSRGANIDGLSNVSESSLTMSAANAGIYVPGFLIEHGADISRRNARGETCLIVAARGNPELVEYLLVRNPDVNVVDMDGHSAIYHAIAHGRTKIIRLLLEHKSLRLDGMRRDLLTWAALIPSCFANMQKKKEIMDLIACHSRQEEFDLINSLELLGAVERDLGCLDNAMCRRFNALPRPIQKILPKLPTEIYGAVREPVNISEMNHAASSSLCGGLERQLLFLATLERIIGPGHDVYLQRLVNMADDDHCSYIRQIRIIDYGLSSSLSASNFEFLLRDETMIFKFLDLLEQITMNMTLESTPMDVDMISDAIVSIMACFVGEIAKVGDAGRRLFLACSILQICKFCVEFSVQLFPMREQIRILRAINPRVSSGGTLLHTLVSLHFSDFPKQCESNFERDYPFFQLGELLENGFDSLINEPDDDGNTAFMLMSAELKDDFMYRLGGPIPEFDELVELLIAKGAHPDACNRVGQTFYDLLPHDYSHLKSPKLYSLECLAARATVKHMVPYRHVLPQAIRQFVVMHDSVKI